MSVKMSLVLITAREDFAMLGLPDIHVLGPCMSSLVEQSFTDFELIVVDGLYKFRPDMFNGNPFDTGKLPFKVKHVPVHPLHSFWFSKGRPFSCAAFNTGLLHASGELVVKIDDCCQFNKEYLATIWDFYSQYGYFPLSMHVRYVDGKPVYFNQAYRDRFRETDAAKKYVQDAVFEKYYQLYGEGGLIGDSRLKVVKENGGRMIAERSWFYGYSSMSLDAALRVNGMDELMDADFSIMDVDLGNRIAMSEGDNLFILDEKLTVIEHSHLQVSPRIFVEPYSLGAIKCNYAILKLNERKNRFRANQDLLSDDDLEFIKKETLRHPCSWNPHQYMDDCEGPMFKLWASNQPIFDLKEERKNVQR